MSKPKPKFKIGDIVVVKATLPNFKMKIGGIKEHNGIFEYSESHWSYSWPESKIELFDPNKKYPFTA